MVTRSSGGGGQCVLWTIWAFPLLSLSLLFLLSTDCSFCQAPELVLCDKTFFFPLLFSSGAQCDISVWINFHWAFLRERPLALHWKLWLLCGCPGHVQTRQQCVENEFCPILCGTASHSAGMKRESVTIPFLMRWTSRRSIHSATPYLKDCCTQLQNDCKHKSRIHKRCTMRGATHSSGRLPDYILLVTWTRAI